jgi:adenylate kinase
VYRDQTEPLKDYYNKSGMLYRVDGMGKVEEVFSRVEKILNTLKR